MTIFHSLSTLLYRARSQRKIKRTGQATWNNSLIFSCNSTIYHVLNCQKTWEKWPKWSNILKNNQFSYIWALLFSNLSHSQRQEKSNWKHTYKFDSNDFMEIVQISVNNVYYTVNYSKFWENRPQRRKILNWPEYFL